MRGPWYIVFAVAIAASIELFLFALMVLLTQTMALFRPASSKLESLILIGFYGLYSSGLVAAALLGWRTRPPIANLGRTPGVSILVALGLGASVGLQLWFASDDDLFSSAYFPVPFAIWLLLAYGYPMLPNKWFERARGA